MSSFCYISVFCDVFKVSYWDANSKCHSFQLYIKSNQTVFVTCTECNKCRPYREMFTYEPLTNSAVQEELRKY
jgi:hypothetical protein